MSRKMVFGLVMVAGMKVSCGRWGLDCLGKKGERERGKIDFAKNLVPNICGI
jgi:hypothetical protein